LFERWQRVYGPEGLDKVMFCVKTPHTLLLTFKEGVLQLKFANLQHVCTTYTPDFNAEMEQDGQGADFSD
jgi:hypothetical protein